MVIPPANEGCKQAGKHLNLGQVAGTHAQRGVVRIVDRYFFHLRDDLDVEDEEGTDLPDLDAAISRSVVYAIDMAATAVLEQRKLDLHHRIEVADAAGTILHTTEFRDVLVVVQ